APYAYKNTEGGTSLCASFEVLVPKTYYLQSTRLRDGSGVFFPARADLSGWQHSLQAFSNWEGCREVKEK
ncbi:MAG: hypothetical protein AAB305_01330, partial [Candidatus Zixiibacteriota bacterium]